MSRVRILADVLAPYFYALRAAEKAKRSAIVRAEAQAREEGLRLGALQLTQALEFERQRIGMDLHDQTLADLTRIMRDISRGSVTREATLAHLQDCVHDLRRIIDTAMPTLLELFGFAHSIRMHLERAVGNDPFVEISVNDETGGAADLLDPTTRIALFRIAQEAINNAARHSHASEISVRIDNRNGLRTIISDNGVGLSSDLGYRAVEYGAGGLAHMHTRARLINAAFAVRPADPSGRGTAIEVRLASPGDRAAPARAKRRPRREMVE